MRRIRKQLWALVHERGHLFRADVAGMKGLYPAGRFFESRWEAQGLAQHLLDRYGDRLEVVKVWVTVEEAA